MSLHEVVQVKGRFNGGFREWLLEAPLFSGVSEAITDVRSLKDEHKNQCVLTSVSNASDSLCFEKSLSS